ncbi:hypothetical protein E4631_06095 [Hymenobacter sp. UV11]|uniref:hypothetical protein n=1 Tax=Hymenobacter sp. UV11 TaxID=1849735 RepID=UPI00105C4D7F|nr:hypothetical protein [Hymenobacter sp. UV11]TFZ67548.1 hypothetical protein E4631_06095 [Hymenobacter sp. UV11]
MTFTKDAHGGLESYFDSLDVERKIYFTSKGYFPSFVKESLNTVKSHLKTTLEKKLYFTQEHLLLFESNFEKLSNGICTTIELYYDGKILEATSLFNATLENIKFTDTIKIFSRYKNHGDSQGNYQKNGFFRARFSEAHQLQEKELFHLPFEKRHEAKTTRYSIPGLPALFLGGSVFTCWEEFDRPSVANLHIAKFIPQRELNIVRILRPFQFRNITNSFLPTLEQNDPLRDEKNEAFRVQVTFSYLAILPLVIACVFRTEHPKAIFKPEYIIPQLLLQYVVNKDEIDGIMYPSTKIDLLSAIAGNPQNIMLTTVDTYNYVFPVKRNQPSGYSHELQKLFHMTQSVSFTLEEVQYLENADILGHVALVPGMAIPYKNTRLGRLEWYLNQLPTTQLIF